MVISDWSNCSGCGMCANYTDFKKVLESTQECPMCETKIEPMSIKICDDPENEFKTLVALMKDPTETKDEADGELEDSDDADLLK